MNPLHETWITEFLETLKQDNLTGAISILERRKKSTGTPYGKEKVQALNVLLCLVSSPEKAYSWTKRLLDSESPTARDLGRMLAATYIGPFFQKHPHEAHELALRIADDPYWEVREGADDIFVQMLKANFEKAYHLLQQWTQHPSENVRRAVVLTAKKAGKERKPEWGEPLLALLEPLLEDRIKYVRKNLGPFAIGDGLLRYYPELTLEHLSRWARLDSEQVRWNVAMTFSSAEAAKHLESALPILEQLASDQRRFVWRAVASAIRNLGRRQPTKVMPVLQEWLHDEQRRKVAEAALPYLSQSHTNQTTAALSPAHQRDLRWG